MRVLVVGGGGREHAIARALAQNDGVTIFSVMAKKNPGIAALSEVVCIEKETNIDAVTLFATTCDAEYAFIGPEAPLEAGLVDALESQGVRCAGPCREAALIETDKAFCRRLMEEENIAGCPVYAVFHDAEEACGFIDTYGGDLAIKPIGLTGGKGVRIMGEHFDAEGAKEYIRQINGDVVLEERLCGEEFTLQTFVDGNQLVPMPLVQDHKRAYEGDIGPNTGGMGSYSLPDHRLPFVTNDDYEAALSIMRAVVAALRKKEIIYKGILYGQFMNTATGPMVIEFNARFGDPEAMNVLSLFDGDFSAVIRGIADSALSPECVSFAPKATVCKYLVPEGYPDAPHAGDPIAISAAGETIVYYANVLEEDGKLFTQTSRTLAFVGSGSTLAEAEASAEKAAASVKGAVRYRKDIGTEEVLARRISHMKEIR